MNNNDCLVADKTVRFDIICDIMQSNLSTYAKEDAIRIVCGLPKKEAE